MDNPKVNSIVSGFLEYLKKDGSSHLLPEIIRKLNSSFNDVLVLTSVTSSSSLSKSQKDKILTILKQSFNIKTVDFIVDKTLIGGIKVTIGDKVIDLSLKNKFNQVSNLL